MRKTNELLQALPGVLVLAVPFAALAGNSVADIAAVLLGFALLAHCLLSRDWRAMRQPWLLMALLFWLWAMLCAFVSEWRAGSLNDAWVWFRFPLFAASLAFFLANRPKLPDRLLLSMLAATAFASIYILAVRLMDGTAERIEGPFGMERPGWYLFGFGLPSILFLRHAVIEKRIPPSAYLAVLTLIFLAFLASFQIYVTFAFLLGVAIYTFLTWRQVKWDLLIILLVCACALALILSNGPLLERFTVEILRTMPWIETSRYHNFWMGGITAALENPAFGVGPDNYNSYCRAVVDGAGRAAMGFSAINESDGCLNHPHQRYIQIAAETGLPGLLLFVGMAGVFLSTSLRLYRRSKHSGLYAIGIALVVINFWPISTYSEAFGQKLNFFYWLHLGLVAFLFQREFDRDDQADQHRRRDALRHGVGDSISRVDRRW